MSSNNCARCDKTVYPVEGLRCLDKIWHKGCFKCHECNMTLSLKNYKGFEKRPYCNAHCPQAKATTVADTPEIRRLAENTRIQSQAKYHEDFEKSRGKNFTPIADDPETRRIKETSKIISNVAYHGEIERKKQMEERRGLSGQEDLPLVRGNSNIVLGNNNNNNNNNGPKLNRNSQSLSNVKQTNELQHHLPNVHQQIQHPQTPQHYQQQQFQQQQQQQQQLQRHQQQLMHQQRQQQLLKQQQQYLAQQQDQQHLIVDRQSMNLDQQLLMQRQQQQMLLQQKRPTNMSIMTARQPPKQAILSQTSHHHPFPIINGPTPHMINILPNGQRVSHMSQQSSGQVLPNQILPMQPTGRPISGPPRRVFRAMYDYVANDIDEVSFYENDLLVDCVNVDRNWLIGKVARSGQTGMLPANYVTELPSQ